MQNLEAMEFFSHSHVDILWVRNRSQAKMQTKFGPILFSSNSLVTDKCSTQPDVVGKGSPKQSKKGATAQTILQRQKFKALFFFK